MDWNINKYRVITLKILQNIILEKIWFITSFNSLIRTSLQFLIWYKDALLIAPNFIFLRFIMVIGQLFHVNNVFKDIKNQYV